MERFSFRDDVAFVPRGDLLDGVRIAPLTQPFEERALAQAAIFRFAPGGRIRRHPGTYPQIISVLEGSGSGTSGVDAPIGAGEAVYLHEGKTTRSSPRLGSRSQVVTRASSSSRHR